MSTNAESTRRNYGNSLKLTNWILDSGTTGHMEPDISDFIPGLLVQTDKYIQVVHGNFVTAKKPRRTPNKNTLKKLKTFNYNVI